MSGCNCNMEITNMDKEEIQAMEEIDQLKTLYKAVHLFELQRAGNPQPVLLEFAWNDVVKVHEAIKETI